MNDGKRVSPFDRGAVEVGGWLYRFVVWLLLAGILVGVSIVLGHLFGGREGMGP